MELLNDSALKKVVSLLLLFNGPSDAFHKHYGQVLAKTATQSNVFLDSLVRALESPGRLTMSENDLLKLAGLLNQKNVNRAVYKRLSPTMQSQHKELSEITLAANAAPYAVPLGGMLRRRMPGKKKT